MLTSPSASARAVAGLVGTTCVVAALAFWWWSSRPSAPPGSVPAVPAANGAPPPLSPAEGLVVPHVSTADAAKIKRGETVTIDVPGGGKIEMSSPKKGVKK